MGSPSGNALFNFHFDDAKWDLSELSYNEWLDFIFNHPVTKIDEGWCWEEEWTYKISNSLIVLEYLIELFTNPKILSEKYSEPQLEQGFWFLMGSEGFSDIAWDKKIPLEKRIKFIRLNASLFRNFFSKFPLDTISYMWWDLFESGYYCNNCPIDQDDASIQEAMLWTLGEILGMDDWNCVCSALHGLNHLHHPRVPEFIDYFLATKQGLDEIEEIRPFALACLNGEAL